MRSSRTNLNTLKLASADQSPIVWISLCRDGRGDDRMRLVSWNVNGIRAGLRKGLEVWVETTQPDLLCLQETKAHPDQLTESARSLCGRQSCWSSAQRAGYSGVATFSREPVAHWQAGIGIERFDAEGRVIRTDVGDLSVYNVYFPNGKASAERLAYKYDFYDAFLAHIDAEARTGRNVIFCGDVNTAHHPIDLARPKENAKVSGFLPEERAHLDRWAAHGWVDSFRAQRRRARGVHLVGSVDAGPGA